MLSVRLPALTLVVLMTWLPGIGVAGPLDDLLEKVEGGLGEMAGVKGAPKSLSAMVDNSVGYLNLSPGKILIEGEGWIAVCRIRISDAAFAREDPSVGDSSVQCIPLKMLDNAAGRLQALMEDSVGYVTVAEDTILIEASTNGASSICRLDIDDALFGADAAAAEAAVAVADGGGHRCVTVAALDRVMKD